MNLEYYKQMLQKGQGYVLEKDNRMRAIITFNVGYEDSILDKDPWEYIEHDPNGDTVYVDQFISKAGLGKDIFKLFSQFIVYLKYQFPNVKQIKWRRVSAEFRKHKNLERAYGRIFNKNI